MFDSVESENKLLNALENYQENWMNNLPSKEELDKTISFSDEFKTKMEKLIKREKKPYYIYVNTTGKRVAVIVAAIIIAGTLAMSVEAIRKPVVEFFVQTFEKISRVTFAVDENSATESQVKTIPNKILVKYELPYIPKGFDEIAFQSEDELGIVIEYTDSKNNIIGFNQSLLKGNTLGIDTEGTNTEEIYIGEHKGVFWSNKGYNNILWNNGEYAFMVTGTLPKETILDLARNIKIKK